MKREETKKENNMTEPDREAVQLISAEPEQEEYAPVLRVLIAVAYMGVLAAVIGALAALLGAVSGRQADQKIMMCAGAFLAFAALAAVLSLIDRRKRRGFESATKRLLESAVRFEGEVVSAEKLVKRIRYANEWFEDRSWRFVIRYNDENGDTVTVKSGRYLNDISNVLKNTKVSVVRTSDGAHTFEGFELRDNGEKGVTLRVAETGGVTEGE